MAIPCGEARGLDSKRCKACILPSRHISQELVFVYFCQHEDAKHPAFCFHLSLTRPHCHIDCVLPDTGWCLRKSCKCLEEVSRVWLPKVTVYASILVVGLLQSTFRGPRNPQRERETETETERERETSFPIRRASKQASEQGSTHYRE